jgi:hypothetical protein
VQASASCRTFLLYSAVKDRLLALDVTSVGGRGGMGRWFDEWFTSSRCLLALYTKLRAGSCLTHVGREGGRWQAAIRRARTCGAFAISLGPTVASALRAEEAVVDQEAARGRAAEVARDRAAAAPAAAVDRARVATPRPPVTGASRATRSTAAIAATPVRAGRARTARASR